MILDLLKQHKNINHICEFGGDSCFYQAFRKNYANANYVVFDNSKKWMKIFNEKYALKLPYKQKAILCNLLESKKCENLESKDSNESKRFPNNSQNLKDSKDFNMDSKGQTPIYYKEQNNVAIQSNKYHCKAFLESKISLDSKDSSSAIESNVAKSKGDSKGESPLTLSKSDIKESSQILESIFCLVFSAGLIEHFDKNDTKAMIEQHFNATKSSGIVLITYLTPTRLYKCIHKILEILRLWEFHYERALFFDEVDFSASHFGELGRACR